MTSENQANYLEKSKGLTRLLNRFIKFTGVGVIGTLAHYLVLIVFVQAFQFNSVAASSIGALIGAFVNYFLNYRYTFNSSKKHHIAISQFFVIAGISFVFNGLLMALLTESLSFHYLLAQFLTTAILLIWNFLGNQFWTFREPLSYDFQKSNLITNVIDMNKNNATIVPKWKTDKLFIYIVIFSGVYLFWGVWWGWPSSLDQHDPTRFAIKMLQHRSLDPGRRYYGSFGYQEVLLLSVLPITILKKILSLDPEFAEALMFLVTRILWALKSLATVAFTYWISLELFRDRRAALIATLLLALSPGFIAWSHTPQLDIVHAFWYCLATAFTAAGWNRSSIKLLWTASLFAGLTASIKYLGGVIVLAPMFAVYLLLPFKAASKYAALFMITALSIFFVTTPLTTGSPVAWLPEFTADVLYNQHRETENPLAFWTMPGTISDMIGPGTTVLAFVSLAIFLFSSKSSIQNRSKQAIAILASCFVPYYLLLSWQHVATIRYLLPLGPILLVAVGVLLSKSLENRKILIPLLALIIPAGALQLALTTSLIVGYSTETRLAMASWLEAHTEPQDQVETILNHRPFFAEKPSFQVVNRPHFQAESYDMKRLVDDDKDSTVRKLHNAFIRLAGKKPGELITWVDRERAWLAKSAATFDTSLRGPVARQSKYVAVNINTAKHYIVDWNGVDPLSPNEKDFIRAMLNEQEPFKQVAEFSPVIPKWLRYPEELWFNLSPVIKIYEVKRP